MSEENIASRRQFLGFLLGGGALLLGVEDADAARRSRHRAHRRLVHKAHSHHSKGRPHAAAPHPAQAKRAAPLATDSAVRSAPGVSLDSPGGFNSPMMSIGGGGGGAGGGGGGGGGGWSDRRLKRDIVRWGASPSGLPVYAFQYVWGGPRYLGVMAQDLLTLRPDAVHLDVSGYYWIDYTVIDVKLHEEARESVFWRKVLRLRPTGLGVS